MPALVVVEEVLLIGAVDAVDAAGVEAVAPVVDEEEADVDEIFRSSSFRLPVVYGKCRRHRFTLGLSTSTCRRFLEIKSCSPRHLQTVH